MKTILLISVGAILQSAASNHPGALMLLLAILAGFALALIAAFVFVGPTPHKPVQPAEPPARKPASKAAKRQPKKTNFQIQHGIAVYDYPQGAMA